MNAFLQVAHWILAHPLGGNWAIASVVIAFFLLCGYMLAGTYARDCREEGWRRSPWVALFLLLLWPVLSVVLVPAVFYMLARDWRALLDGFAQPWRDLFGK